MATYPLPSIEEASPLSEKDAQLVDELKSVLRRHGALERFGLVLLHDHFPVEDDEVLVETNDPETRTLVTQPVRLSSLPRNRKLMQTSWRLDVPDSVRGDGSRCVTSCYVDLKDRHTRKHERTPLPPNR